MTIDIILNELSLQAPAPDAVIARQWMSNFVQTIRAIQSQAKEQAILRTQYDFHTALLASDYPIRKWLNDAAIDREEQRFIRTLATKAPFSQDILNTEIKELKNQIGLSEFLYEGQIAIGLGTACILDTIPISLKSKSCWDSSYLEIDIVRIDENDEKLTIIHASQKEHLKEHVQWFKSWRLRQELNGSILWDRKEALFPNLKFCDSVKDQLTNIRTGDKMLHPIERRLSNLQTYAESWINGAFKPDKISCKTTSESEATLQQYVQERTFLCPDGQNRVFSWHVRLTPLAWRIHFYPSRAGEILIGYIGPHLRTSKFN
ncbi:MAG: hypothetical protein ACO3NK_00075 [Prochlorotrichaceae cyanobacterium]